MKVAIHQPQYLPWQGYFDKMDQADVFVLLDDVQYKKNEWQNRNKIRNAEGWQWITVPVLSEFGQKIKDVKVNNNEPWQEKHLKSIELNYSKAPYFDQYSSFFRDVYKKDWERLAEISICFMVYLKDALGISTELVRSSSLGVEAGKTDRLVEICKKLGADTYLSGAGGSEYLDEDRFIEEGLRLEYQNYEQVPYKQVYNDFYPHMSVVDLLFCSGQDSLDIIKEGRKE